MKLRPLLATVAATGLLAGCAGSTSSSDTTTAPTAATSVLSVAPPTTTDAPPLTTDNQPATSATSQTTMSTAPEEVDGALVAALDGYNAAILDGNAEASYSYLSESCKDETSRVEWAEGANSTTFYESLGLEASDVSTTNRVINIDGDQAYVSYDVVGPDGRPLFGDGKSTIYALWIVEADGSWRRDYCSETGSPLEGHAAAASAAESNGSVGTRDNPVPLGEPADVGDGWTLTVNSVILNANDQISAVNENNPPPPDGYVYVTVNVTTSWSGEGSNESGVNIGALGEGTNAMSDLGTSKNGALGPDPIYRSSVELFDGGSNEGNVVLEVPTADIDTLVISGQGYSSFDKGDRKFFAVK